LITDLAELAVLPDCDIKFEQILICRRYHDETELIWRGF